MQNGIDHGFILSAIRAILEHVNAHGAIHLVSATQWLRQQDDGVKMRLLDGGKRPSVISICMTGQTRPRCGRDNTSGRPQPKFPAMSGWLLRQPERLMFMS